MTRVAIMSVNIAIVAYLVAAIVRKSSGTQNIHSPS